MPPLQYKMSIEMIITDKYLYEVIKDYKCFPAQPQVSSQGQRRLPKMIIWDDILSDRFVIFTHFPDNRNLYPDNW